jgi:hypothetical protein
MEGAMEATARGELEVLLEQLEELVGAPVLDVEDALEIATVAGSAARLGADPAVLKEAEAWRDGDGALLIQELWEQVDGEPLIEALDAASEGSMSDEEVEEALYDLDDLVVAAIWCKRRAEVRPTVLAAEKVVRSLPDVFVEYADVARALIRRREVAEELDLYGYWLAIVEAADNS